MAFDDRQVQAAYNYVGYRLERKPDIYLIFVESYGSVLYKRSHFTPAVHRPAAASWKRP
jgi:hypothetical protein